MYKMESMLVIMEHEDLKGNLIQSLNEASGALEEFYRNPSLEKYKAWKRADNFMINILSEIERRRYVIEGKDDGQLSIY